MASFPDSVKSFAARSNGQTIDAAHVGDLQDEVNAIEAGYLNGTARLNSSASTLASLDVNGNSTLASSITLGTLPYVFPASGGSTGTVLMVDSTSGSTMTLKWGTAASSAASDGFSVSTGVLTLNQGQIKFPATQVASADANTLDDYEEGSWTPTFTGSGGGSGQTYSNQTGNYIKIGKFVFARYIITLSAEGTITDNLRLGGLPFTVGGTTHMSATSPSFTALATNWVSVLTIPADGTTQARVEGSTAAGTANRTALTSADTSDTTDFRGALIYEASA